MVLYELGRFVFTEQNLLSVREFHLGSVDILCKIFLTLHHTEITNFERHVIFKQITAFTRIDLFKNYSSIT